jgi:hypothetical protein
MRDPQDTKYVWDEENFKIIESSISTALESKLVDTRKFLRQTQELCHEYLDAKITAERERDEARAELEEYRSIAEKIGATKAVSERDKAVAERNETRKQNAKLCDIAKRAIKLIPPEIYGEHSYAKGILSAELDQIKEGAK